MANHTLKNATMAAVLTAIIVMPVFGLQLVRQGARTHLEAHWEMVALAAAVVFVFQLVRPWLAKPFQRLKTSIPVLPAAPAKGNKWIIALLILAAVVWPFFSGRSSVDIATLVLIYVMLGLGLNIVVGFAGLLDLGFVGFYAVGAYTYALLYHWADWGFWQALPLAGAMAALFGFLLGFPVLRLRGDYLAIVTLGFGEIIRILLNNFTSLTNGPNGIGNIPKPDLFGLEFSRRAIAGAQTFHELFGIDYNSWHRVMFLYFLALVLVLFTLFVINRLLRMPVGRAWEALREDEVACRSLGINPTAVKLNAFTIGATFAGFAGCFFAARQGFISPE